MFSACGQNCMECLNKQCKTCQQKYFLNDKNECVQCKSDQYLLNNTCVNFCPIQFQEDETNKICICDKNATQVKNDCICNPGYKMFVDTCDKQECNLENCDQCASENECEKCSNGFFKDYNKKCVSKCPPTFIENKQESKCECMKNSTQNGDSCKCDTGYELNGNSCQAKCNMPNCESCKDTAECDSCQNGYFKSSDKICIKTCPSTFIENITNKSCDCDTNATLVDSNNAKECKCNQNYYQKDNKCTKCTENCSKCLDNAKCDTCQTDYFLFADGTCNVCDKQQGYFVRDKQCIKCQDQCLECTDEKTCIKQSQCAQKQVYNSKLNQCVQCLWDLQSKKCVDKCRDDQTYSAQNMTCNKCFLYENECKEKCPTHYYPDKQNKCMECHSSCKECKGPSENQCTLCQLPNVIQHDQSCSQCEYRQYYDQNTNSCHQCYWKCKTCNGPTELDCLTCMETFTFSQEESQCHTQTQVSDEIVKKEMNQYSECEQTGQDCESSLAFANQIQKFSNILLIINLLVVLASIIFSSELNLITWYFIQIQQLLGNFIFSQDTNLFWMNIGYLKNQYSFNIFNILSSNFFQNKKDLYIDINNYDFGLQISNIYVNFIQNCFYQVLTLFLIVIFMLVCLLLKNQSQFLKKIYSYLIFNVLSRYFMITSNSILLFFLLYFKYGDKNNSTNHIFILPAILIYLSMQVYQIFVIVFKSHSDLVNTIQVLLIDINQEKCIQKLFWTIFELRKIVCVFSIMWLKETHYYGVAIILISILFLIYVVIARPFGQRRNQLIVIITEVFCISLFLLYNFISSRKNIGLSTKIAFYLSISYVFVSIILNVFYIVISVISIAKQIRMYIINKKHNRLLDQTQQPVIQQFKVFNSTSDIETILSQINTTHIKWSKPSNKY